jgi:hypothetical protein
MINLIWLNAGVLENSSRIYRFGDKATILLTLPLGMYVKKIVEETFIGSGPVIRITPVCIA